MNDATERSTVSTESESENQTVLVATFTAEAFVTHADGTTDQED